MRARKVKLYLYIIVVNSSCYIQRLLTKFRSSSSVLRSTFPHLLHPNDRADTQQLQFQSSKKGYEEDLANWRRFLKIVETEVGFDPLYPRTWDIYMEGNSHRSKQVPIHLPPSLTLLTAHIKKKGSLLRAFKYISNELHQVQSSVSSKKKKQKRTKTAASPPTFEATPAVGDQQQQMVAS